MSCDSSHGTSAPPPSGGSRAHAGMGSALAFASAEPLQCRARYDAGTQTVAAGGGRTVREPVTGHPVDAGFFCDLGESSPASRSHLQRAEAADIAGRASFRDCPRRRRAKLAKIARVSWRRLQEI